MDSEKKVAQDILDGLDAIIPLQEISYKTHKLRGESVMSNPIAFAKESVRHFYGMETGNLLIDLDFEKRHLGYFYQHLVNNSKGEGFKELEEVRTASRAYIEAIDRYTHAKNKEAVMEYLAEEEGKDDKS